jgi:hypothetical protein
MASHLVRQRSVVYTNPIDLTQIVSLKKIFADITDSYLGLIADHRGITQILL